MIQQMLALAYIKISNWGVSDRLLIGKGFVRNGNFRIWTRKISFCSPLKTPSLHKNCQDLNPVWMFPWWLSGKESICNADTVGELDVRSLGWKDFLEKGMATDFRILAWRILWTEEPSWLQSIGSQKVRHDWSGSTHSNPLWLQLKVRAVASVMSDPLWPYGL